MISCRSIVHSTNFLPTETILQQLFKINSMKFDPVSIKKVIQDASQDETESMRSVKKTTDTNLFVVLSSGLRRQLHLQNPLHQH